MESKHGGDIWLKELTGENRDTLGRRGKTCNKRGIKGIESKEKVLYKDRHKTLMNYGTTGFKSCVILTQWFMCIAAVCTTRILDGFFFSFSTFSFTLVWEVEEMRKNGINGAGGGELREKKKNLFCSLCLSPFLHIQTEKTMSQNA